MVTQAVVSLTVVVVNGGQETGLKGCGWGSGLRMGYTVHLPDELRRGTTGQSSLVAALSKSAATATRRRTRLRRVHAELKP